MDKRNVPASDATQKVKPWKLTKNQWLVYYWMLAHSNWNSFQKENHYFLYKNAYTNTQIMRDTGIKSPNTMTSAVKKLVEVGAIAKSDYADAWEIYTSIIFVPLDVDIIKFILAFHNYLDTATCMTLYAILARMLKFNKGNPVSFTLADLGRYLGYANPSETIDRPALLLIISLLSQTELITINQFTYTNSLGSECIRYTLFNVDTTGDKIQKYLNDDNTFDEDALRASWDNMLSINYNQFCETE